MSTLLQDIETKNSEKTKKISNINSLDEPVALEQLD